MSYPRDEIEALVRRVVSRTLGASPAHSRPIIDAEAVRAMPRDSVQPLTAGVLVTPLARQVAMERKVRLVEDDSLLRSGPAAPRQAPRPAGARGPGPVVAVGADHGGFDLKEQLRTSLEENYQLIDCGTHSADSVDYPDFAYAVARLVADGRAWRGIIVDGAGIGSCMAANKVPGIRAAMCYDQATAVNSREHNNANVLTLGAGLIGPELARQIVVTWLTTDFGGGRHARRVDKIDQIDRRYRH